VGNQIKIILVGFLGARGLNLSIHKRSCVCRSIGEVFLDETKTLSEIRAEIRKVVVSAELL